MKTLAVIHAKGTSERLPNKNIKELGDKPLFCHVLDTALQCKFIDEVVIDSDSDEILEIGREHGATPCKRPSEYATNDTNGDDLLYRIAQLFDADIFVQLFPTAPFLKAKTIDNAIGIFYNFACDSMMGVNSKVFYEIRRGMPIYYVRNRRPNSQDMQHIVYETCGLYIVKRDYILKKKKRVNPDNCLPMLISDIESIDIDTQEDFEFAEIVWRGIRS